MTFEMVRMGWPNTAAIVVLAVMPIVSLATIGRQDVDTVQTLQREAATLCPSLPDGASRVATLVSSVTAE